MTKTRRRLMQQHAETVDGAQTAHEHVVEPRCGLAVLGELLDRFEQRRGPTQAGQVLTGATERLDGLGLGDDVDAVKTAFKVPLKPAAAPDLFSAICTKGMDTLIADATAANVAQRLPAWYRSSVNAPTFLLLPMAMKGKTFALIYADKGKPGGIEVDEKELSLLRTLRNQAVMAFRQLGS